VYVGEYRDLVLRDLEHEPLDTGVTA